MASRIHEDIKNFRQFDVVTDVWDHYFLIRSRMPSAAATTHGSEMYKRIMQEWRSLERDLPESIYVRVYEGRIDLMRAVIIGASGTPYHDGLFFFDFKFPDNYPHAPPEVYFKSFGLQFPNLFANGRVCLSLLNTWMGPQWVCGESTILQVLVSLQALVLTERPFYNESFFEKWDGKVGKYISSLFDNEAFVNSCKLMTFLLRSPPNNFEGFVIGHFYRRSRAILTACKVYENGFARVGQYREDGSFLPERVKVLKSFKKSMERMYQLLAADFSKNDTSLAEFLIEINELIEKTNSKYDVAKALEKKKNKFTKKLIEVVKKFWGMNKCITSNAADSNRIKSS